MRRERIFQTELRQAVKKIPGTIEIGNFLLGPVFWYKFPDAPNRFVKGGMSAEKKPFDIIAMYNGYTFAIETKAEDAYGSADHSKDIEKMTMVLRDHQKSALRLMGEFVNCIPLVLFNRRGGAGNLRVNMVFVWALIKHVWFLSPEPVEYAPGIGWDIQSILGRIL